MAWIPTVHSSSRPDVAAALTNALRTSPHLLATAAAVLNERCRNLLERVLTGEPRDFTMPVDLWDDEHWEE